MRNIFTVLLLSFSFALMAQVAPNYYAIKFTDKDNNTYTLDNPEAFLSARSMERRVNQGISYDLTDLPITSSYVNQVAEIGVEVKRQVKWINTILVKTTNPTLIEEILALSFVESATKIADVNANPPIKPKNFFEVEEELEQNNIQASRLKSTSTLNYGQATEQIELINGIPLHDMGYQGQGMVIAVLDGGFIGVPDRIVFDSLYANGQILGARDFCSEENDPFAGSTHGTKVLSTMGANWPGQMIGTAPKADYWLLRTEYTDYENIIEEYNWLVGAAFADSVGADIINSSLGYTTFDDSNFDHTWNEINGNTAIVTIGADLAAKKGILPVNSAGNDGSSSWQYVGFPADGDSVFAIGATDYSGNIASFSSRGYPMDSRIKPNICAVGSGTTVADAYSDFISSANGTSFSSPTIAGMTACLWQANPEFNNKQIMDLLEMSASQASNPDKTYGYGIPDYEAANAFVGIETSPQKETASFEVYPNPSRDYIHLSLQSDISELRIYSSNGQLIYQTYGNQTDINVSKLNTGIYMIQVVIGNGVSQSKFYKE
ncbi:MULTISPECIES: S8/S53 family peptidase [unclassified Lentimicrobium]|uniref:S8/S53 family peptidase n=1 Tax=unclassified Lentimicrobium TaxID=2677434 RepID=UPI001557B23F|nr:MULTISPECIES: S8/S53 family peptidase [unclassified Lentimicrobium]NPD45492.1 S8 family serine peptidase [Lentimicrobium sp. S6]NPD84002.1 S8 family serine peptidase [Lentimicrobium sp. L6]